MVMKTNSKLNKISKTGAWSPDTDPSHTQHSSFWRGVLNLLQVIQDAYSKLNWQGSKPITVRV